jgi:hypothetical protein
MAYYFMSVKISVINLFTFAYLEGVINPGLTDSFIGFKNAP